MDEWHAWPGDICPRDGEDVLVTVTGLTRRPPVRATVFTSPTVGLFACEMVFALEVVAWMPFPEAYQAKRGIL